MKQFIITILCFSAIYSSESMICSNLYASEPVTVWNVLTKPLNLVFHKTGEIAYVSSPDNHSILVIDCSIHPPVVLRDRQIDIPVSLYQSPIGPLAINPIQDELYVIDEAQSLFVIDTQTNTLNPTPITIPAYATNIVVSKDGQALFVSSNQKITIINAESKTVETTIAINDNDLYGMAQVNNNLYVTGGFLSENLYVIDLTLQSVIQTIKVNEYPHRVITSPDEKKIYISHSGAEGYISVINTSTNTVETTIDLEGNSKSPMDMAIVHSILYVANKADGTISQINIQNDQEIICNQSLPSGDKYPEYVAPSPDSNFLYVTHPSSKSINVVDITTSCPSIKKNLDDSVYNDQREMTLEILDTGICDNQPLTFTVSTDQPELFVKKPSVSSSGILHYQPYTKNAGITRIDISLIDPTGKCSSSESFYLTVIATGPVLTLEKKGRGQIQISDGDETFNVLTPWEGQFIQNAPIKLTALPDDNHIFSSWSGGITDQSNPVELILTKDINIQANFLDVTAYGIIILGKRFDGEGLLAHEKTCDLAWQTFISRGVDTNYLKYDGEGGFESPSVDAVHSAITEWAFEKLKGKSGNLTILLVGHGNKNVVYVDGEPVRAAVFNGWLNELQLKLKEVNQNNTIIIAIGACYSGSFIDELSGQNRIIITSSDQTEMAFKGPQIDSSLRQGDFFMAEFIKKIGQGYSVKQSFIKSAALTERFTYSISDTFISSHKDQSLQHPLLDDNYDQVGTNDFYVSFLGEGLEAGNVWIGNNNRKRDILYHSDNFISETIRIDEDTTELSFSIDLSDTNSFNQFWIDIKKPTFSIQNQEDDTDQLEMIIDNRFKRKSGVWENIHQFIDPGEYQILFFGEKKETHLIELLKEVIVYKQKADNHPPGIFSILSPENDAEIYPYYYASEKKYSYKLEWEGAIDPDNDTVFYTVFVSLSPNFNNPLVIDQLLINQATLTFSDISLPDTLTFDDRYYIKVKASDKYGAFTETPIFSFEAKKTSAATGCMLFVFLDKISMQQIQMPVLSKKDSSSVFSTIFYEYSILVQGPNTKSVSVILSAAGYENKEEEITIPEGCSEYPLKQSFVLKRAYNLPDIVRLLQLFSDYPCSVSKRLDLNGDSIISLKDIVLMMQSVAGD